MVWYGPLRQGALFLNLGARAGGPSPGWGGLDLPNGPSFFQMRMTRNPMWSRHGHRVRWFRRFSYSLRCQAVLYTGCSQKRDWLNPFDRVLWRSRFGDWSLTIESLHKPRLGRLAWLVLFMSAMELIMSDMHDITISIPSLVGVTLRGHNRELDTTVLPEKTLVWLLQKGIQRGANDPLGALFKKGEDIDVKKLDEYWDDLVTRWDNGDVQKTRSGGLGRTTDPVMREMKRLANVEIDANIAKLLAVHGVTRKEFDESFRAKYVKKRLTDHADRLRAKAEENVAAAKLAAEEDDFEIIDFDADESDDEIDADDDESEVA